MPPILKKIGDHIKQLQQLTLEQILRNISERVISLLAITGSKKAVGKAPPHLQALGLQLDLSAIQVYSFEVADFARKIEHVIIFSHRIYQVRGL